MEYHQAQLIINNFFDSKILCSLNELNLDEYSGISQDELEIREILFDFLTGKIIVSNNQYVNNGELNISENIIKKVINKFKSSQTGQEIEDIVSVLSSYRNSFLADIDKKVGIINNNNLFDNIVQEAFRIFNDIEMNNTPSNFSTDYLCLTSKNLRYIDSIYENQNIDLTGFYISPPSSEC